MRVQWLGSRVSYIIWCIQQLTRTARPWSKALFFCVVCIARNTVIISHILDLRENGLLRLPDVPQEHLFIFAARVRMRLCPTSGYLFRRQDSRPIFLLIKVVLAVEP